MPNALLLLSARTGAASIASLVDSLTAFRPHHLIVCANAEAIRLMSPEDLEALGAAAAEVILTPFEAHGEACAALLASEWIDNDDELLIVRTDGAEMEFAAMADHFREKKLAAGLAARARSSAPTPQVRLGSDGLVVEASDDHTLDGPSAAGAFWFARGSEFLHAAQRSIRKNPNRTRDFGISPTLNELVLANRAVGVFPVEATP